MIAGQVIFEDITLVFNLRDNNTVHYTVTENSINGHTLHKVETKIVPSDAFFKALAIAVHNDGMPDHEADYDEAESIMGDIRWIP